MGVTITEADGVTQEATTRGLVMGMDERTKAPRDGFYRIGNSVFGINAGDYLPVGAEMVGDEPEEAEAVAPVTGGEDEPEEERAKGKAPANRSKGAAPENRGA